MAVQGNAYQYSPTVEFSADDDDNGDEKEMEMMMARQNSYFVGRQDCDNIRRRGKKHKNWTSCYNNKIHVLR